MNHKLVEKMLNAFGTWPWERIGISRDQLRANMSAVLHVAEADFDRRKLGPVTPKEWRSVCTRTPDHSLDAGQIESILSSRRLTAPAKTAERSVFITLWDKAVGTPGYDKEQWIKLERELATLKQEGAE